MAPDLSIVIVNYHTRQFVLDCVASIIAHPAGLNLEIIVIDNASNDGLLAEIAQRFPAVRAIANAENRFFSGAYTQGIELATAPYVLALNPDTVIRGAALGQMLAALRADAALGAVTTMMYFADGALQRNCAEPLRARDLLLMFTPLRRLLPGAHARARAHVFYADWDRTTARDVGMLPGSCILASRETWLRCGCFDARMPMYFSDDYFARRVHALGLRTAYVLSDGIIHFESASAKQFSTRALRMLHADLIVFARLTQGALFAALLWLLALPTRLRLRLRKS